MTLRFKVSLICLAALISTPTLWLVSSPMNYFFYLIEIALIFIFAENFSPFTRVKVLCGKRSATTLLDFIPLILICTILLLDLVGLYYTVVNTILSALIVFFIPGYIITRLLDENFSNSISFKLGVCFALSFVVNGLIYTFTCMFTTGASERRVAIILAYSLLIFGAYITRHFTRRRGQVDLNRKVTYKITDIAIFAVYTIFFVFAILNMYPKTAYKIGYDIVEHFSSSCVAAISPNLLKSAYPWFHFEEAVMYLLSAPPLEVNITSTYMPAYQTVLAFLGILPMVSFYAMAKAYLKDVDERLPVVATGFWMFFSGFGWLFLLGQDYSKLSRLELLALADDKSFWDIGYGGGQSIWFWYRPLTLGFTLLFLLVYLLREESMPKHLFISLSLLLITGLGFAHFSELVVFVGVLVVSSAISPRIVPRLHDMLLATSLGSMLILVISITLKYGGIAFPIDYKYLIILTFLSSASYLLALKWKGFHSKYGKVRSVQFVKILSIVLLILYLSALLESLSPTDFSVWRVVSTQFVPWLLYPVILGIVGLLAIISLSQYREYFDKPVCLFALMFVFMLVFGKVASFINNNYFDTGYWERRLIVHCFAATSMLAPIALLKTCNRLTSKNRLFATILIGLIVVSGVSSTFLSVEYRTLLTEEGSLTNMEMNVASFLFKTLKENSMSSPIFTISSKSRGIAEFAGSFYVVGTGGEISFVEAYPERPLLNLYNWASPSIILITNSDMPLLSSKYCEGYVNSHLLKFMPKVYDDGFSKIYRMLNGTPPSLESETILVLPNDKKYGNYLFAYDILSLSQFDYTTMLMDDPNTYKGNFIVLPYDPQGASDIEWLLRNLGDKNIILINTNGYGAIANSLFEGSFRFMLKANSANTFIMQENENIKKISLNATSMGSIAFTLGNDGNPRLTLADDEISSFWTPMATGEGTIGPPVLNDTSSTMASGANSLLIDVGTGKNAYWILQHFFDSPVNWSDYDFFTFYWFGRNDSSWYVLYFYSSEGYFWYTFRDSWTGWKKVSIPLNMPDGNINFNGVDISKATNKNATWSDIKKILFGLNAKNPNLGGSFYIDKISLEKAVSVKLVGVIESPFTSVNELKLSLVQPTLQSFSVKANETVIIPADSIYFMNYEVDAEKLFGREGYGTIKATLHDTSLLVELSIKMPPQTELELQMEALPASVTEASAINGTYNIELPLKMPIEPILPKNLSTVMSFYRGEQNIYIPLAVKGRYNGYEITYINVYPVIRTLQSDEVVGMLLFPVLGHILKASGLYLPKYSGNTSGLYDFTVAFRSASLKGNVTLLTSNIILDNVATINYRDGNAQKRLQGISSISLVDEDSLKIFAHDVEIQSGKGFYSNITIKDRQLSVTGSNITAYIKLNDGTLAIIKELESLLVYSNSTMASYLREPEIQVTGWASFSDFQPYNKPSFSNLRKSMITNITGTVNFSLPISDVYSWTKSFSYSGKITYNEPLIYWDEWNQMLALIPWTIVSIIFLAVTYLLYSPSSQITMGMKELRKDESNYARC